MKNNTVERGFQYKHHIKKPQIDKNIADTEHDKTDKKIEVDFFSLNP
jgi:hypothetical protein